MNVEKVIAPDFQPGTRMEDMLRRAWEGKNEGCVTVCESGRGNKFCVRGKDESVAFVHLTTDLRFVICTACECDVQRGKKRMLQSLQEATDLCPHLDMFKASREVWAHLIPGNQHEGLDEDEEQDDVNRDDLGQVGLSLFPR